MYFLLQRYLFNMSKYCISYILITIFTILKTQQPVGRYLSTNQYGRPNKKRQWVNKRLRQRWDTVPVHYTVHC